MRVEGVQLTPVKPIKPVNKNIKEQGSLGIKKNNRQDSIDEQIKQQKKEENQKELDKAIEKANKSFEPFDRRLEISVHEKTKQLMVKVIDTSNDEVIRELPPEKIMDMVAHMMEIAGLIVDVKI